MADTKRIRQLIETIFGRDPFVYTVGQERLLPINGKKEKRIITDIELVGDYFELYISTGEESKHWKDIPKSDRIAIDYFID